MIATGAAAGRPPCGRFSPPPSPTSRGRPPPYPVEMISRPPGYWARPPPAGRFRSVLNVGSTAARAVEKTGGVAMRLIHLPIPLLATVALLALTPAALARPASSSPTAPAATPTPAAVEPATAAPAATGFVGSDLCVSCHTVEAEHLAKTPHGKGKFASLSATGCETCHGPGSAHVANPEDKALQPRIDKWSASQQQAVCQK